MVVLLGDTVNEEGVTLAKRLLLEPVGRPGAVLLVAEIAELTPTYVKSGLSVPLVLLPDRLCS